MTTDDKVLGGEVLRLVHEDAEMIRLLNAGCQPDGSYQTCPELLAKWAHEDAPFERECALIEEQSRRKVR